MERIRELESATNMHKQIEKDDYHDPRVFDDSEILSSDHIPEWYQSSPITRPSYDNYQTPPYYQPTTDFQLPLQPSTRHNIPQYYNTNLSSMFQDTQPPPHSYQNPSRLTIRHKFSHALLTTAIDRSKLLPCSTVLEKYPNLRFEARCETLAMRFARESFFGKVVLSKCTLMGCRDFPGLPVNELNSLK